ncbi:spartin-like isoform X2 [Amphiura filiformis]|uniref:spartin-like isoform X2 n=1 Tax=Amphiura filiformis TaxID=82378 RepID=UPI003B20BE49
MAECQETARPRVSNTNGNHSSQAQSSSLSSLKRHHDNAFKDINHALNCDEHGKREEALQAYVQGVQNLMKGLEIQCEGPQCNGEEWNQARAMQKKMKKAAVQMKARLEALEAEIGNRTSQSNGRAPSEDEINMQLHDDLEAEEPPSYQEAQADAREIFHLEGGAQIFFINPQGHVSAPSSPGPLRIYKFTNERQVREANQPPAFMQVGDWLYPLVPGESPALRSREGAYMFPDLTGAPGSSVGVMFAPQTDRNTLQSFKQTIGSLTALREEGEAPPRYTATATPPPRPQERPRPQQRQVPPAARQAEQPRSDEKSPEEEEEEAKQVGTSTKIAKGISVGAEWLSWGLGKGAEGAGYLIEKGKDHLKKNVQSNEKAAEIDEKYQTGVLCARKATGVAVKVSKVVVDGVCYCTKRLGEELAPVIREQGDKWLKAKDTPDGKLSKTVDGAVEVAASSLQGFGTVYLSLESAAKLLAKSISNATVEVVQHKYGTDAGRLADNSLNTATNIGFTAYNMKHLGIKAIAKRTAKDTGKALVKDYETKPDDPPPPPSSS